LRLAALGFGTRGLRNGSARNGGSGRSTLFPSLDCILMAPV
jgi:hypothetical protein